MKIRITEPTPNVLLVTYEEQYDLCMAFVRVQEYYESPKFKGQVFELEEFMDWWSKEYGKGSFDYPARWNGFNFPGSVLANWLSSISLFGSDRLRAKETEWIDRILKRVGGIDNLHKYYIIGVNKGDDMRKQAVDHETAHALYCLYPEYKEACLQLIEELKSTEDGAEIYAMAESKLIDMGYDQSVIDDEIQAYFSVQNHVPWLGIYPEFESNLQMFRESISKKNKKLG